MTARSRLFRLPEPVVLFLVLALGFAAATGGQENASAAAKAAAVLAKFPAESSAERDAAAAELLALGPEGLQAVCRRLVAPGAEDDSLARYALDAAAVYAARPGAERERQSLIRELLRALDAPREPEIKEFLLGELQLVGKGEIVRPVAAFLADSRLAGPAARALTAVGTPEAERALLRALPSAPRLAARAIVQALGDLRSAAAVSSLLPLAASSDAELRRAAETALANIGDPAARPILDRTAVTASSLERSRAASLYLMFARRLWESGRGDQAALICRDFIGAYSSPGESQIRCAALTLLAKIQGPAILDLLLEASGSDDPSFRRKALDLAISIPGDAATARLVEAASKASPEAQADILAALGRRGDKSALGAVRAGLASGEKAVRLAAMAAAAKLGGADVLEEIWPLMSTDDATQARAVKDVLSGFPSDLIVPRAAALLPDAPPIAKPALIELLADRRAVGHVAVVLAQAASDDAAVRKAALTALEALARSEDVPRIIELLQASTAAPEIALLQSALAAAANGTADPERRAEPVLAALDKTPAAKRGDLIRPLARIGGEKALRLVAEKLGDADPQIRSAALYALSNWKDAAALDELAKAAQSGPDRRTRYMALQGIARLAGTAGLGDERQLAVLRSALKIAVENDEKNLVLAAFGSVRSLESLRTLSRSLDATATQARSAQAVLKAVLPAPGIAGMTGYEAALILKKALVHIDDEYDRDQAEAYARKILLREGFSAAFNGKNLSGWKGLVADPPRRAQMTPAALRKAQAEADALMRAHWAVVDGMLVFDGKGQSLCTSRDYADFEMFVDWKIEPKGDSCIYLRGSPQVQIWDQTQSPDGSGGLYNNQIHPSKPLIRADKPVGEWNTFHIRMTGERVTVQLNGVLVTDSVVMENYWERGKPIYPSGQIELQSHNTPLRFRNIYIREIPRPGEAPAAAAPAVAARPLPTKSTPATPVAAALPPAQPVPLAAAPAVEDGFTPLFNGRDLAGWTGDIKGYKVEDGKIVVSPESSDNLYTEREYKDFVFRFEFKLTPGANNGIGIRAPLTGDAAYVGMEIQVLDDSAEVYRNLHPYQYHGSIYGVVPAKRGELKPVGEWNAEEITVQGRRVTVVLNGVTIIDDDIDLASAGGTPDHREHPGLKNETGHIGFLGHGSRVEFRNIRIRDLGRQPAP